jgi:chromosome segregation ATPase
MENKDLIIVVLLCLAIYLYYQNRKLGKLPAERVFVGTDNSTTANSETLFELDENSEDLIAERDQAIRDKKETESELISVSNKLKLKNQEVGNKEKALEELKKEKSKVEIALNGKITEKKKELAELQKKYSKQGQLLDEEQLENNKLEKKITSLETEIEQLKKDQE